MNAGRGVASVRKGRAPASSSSPWRKSFWRSLAVQSGTPRVMTAKNVRPYFRVYVTPARVAIRSTRTVPDLATTAPR